MVAAAAEVADAGSGLHVSASLRLQLRLRLASRLAPARAASVRRPGGGERRAKRPRTQLGTEQQGARQRLSSRGVHRASFWEM